MSPQDDTTSEAPEILSLNDLKINLPQDVYNLLESQYSILDLDDIGSPITLTHIDKILERMKTSPAVTCCRVNLIRSSVDEVVDGLKDHLTATTTNGGHEYIVERHEMTPDLVVIRESNNTAAISSSAMSLYHCNVPPNDYNTGECNNNIFPNWPKRASKGWPTSHRAIIVDRFCGEAVLRGANIFVRGIMAADSGISAGEEVAVYAHLPTPNCKSISRGLALEHFQGRCVFLGMGISVCKRSEYFCQSTGVGVTMNQIAGPSSQMPSLNSILPGKMMLQNLPSVCVAHALDPQPGDVILDMCAAPGGKTTHVASLMNNVGLVVACDKSRKKMLKARDLFQDMGATCIVPLALDSTKLLLELQGDDDRKQTCWKSPQDIVDSASIADEKNDDGLLHIKGFYPNSFDRILLDPPCSALGLRPKLLVDNVKSSKELMKFAEHQQRFVRAAIPLLKPGGTMTYSTCTINACENEDVVKFILREFPCMELVPLDPKVFPGSPGLGNRGLSEEECLMVRRFDPCDEEGDTMGFFLAKFVKKCT